MSNETALVVDNIFKKNGDITTKVWLCCYLVLLSADSKTR